MSENFKEKIAKMLTCLIFPKRKRHLYRMKVAFALGVVPKEYPTFVSTVHFKHKGLLERADKIENIIIGDSHAQAGILPFLINDKTYNYAFNANDLFAMYESLKKAKSLCKNLKKVICTISFYNRGYSLVEGSNAWKLQAVLKELKSESEVDFTINKYNDVKFNERVFNSGIIVSNTKLCQGFDFSFLSPCRFSKKDDQRIKQHFKIYDKYNNQIFLLRKICEFCKNNNLSLYLFVSPNRSDYNRIVSELAQGDDVLSWIKDICQEYNFPLYDARSNYNDECFEDTDHLNIDGAVKFTRDIIDECF